MGRELLCGIQTNGSLRKRTSALGRLPLALELFADHEHLENMLFDGTPRVHAGQLLATGAPGNGMSVTSHADTYRTS